MAEGKNSFLLYCDLIHTVKKLPKEKAGELFLHILEYVNDLHPETDDIIIQIAFEPIKQQLKRDLQHWIDICSIRSESGKKGGRPRKQTKAKKANALLEKQTKAKKADNDTVTVTDNVTEELYKSILVFFDEDCRPRNQDQKNKWIDVLDKLNRIDGHSPEEIKNIIKRTRMDPFWKSNFLSVLKLRDKNKDGISYFTVFSKKIQPEKQEFVPDYYKPVTKDSI